ncbi:MAG: hypothetical protein Q9159_000540 [Coniocarpon cinnabarinum]
MAPQTGENSHLRNGRPQVKVTVKLPRETAAGKESVKIGRPEPLYWHSSHFLFGPAVSTLTLAFQHSARDVVVCVLMLRVNLMLGRGLATMVIRFPQTTSWACMDVCRVVSGRRQIKHYLLNEDIATVSKPQIGSVPAIQLGDYRARWDGGFDSKALSAAEESLLCKLELRLTAFVKHASAPPKTWGVAYHIPHEFVEEVKEYLDIREINGYSIDFAAFHVPVYVRHSSQSADLSSSKSSQQDSQSISCLVYIGMPNNPQFLGPQDPDQLAAHIVRSRGPSGENKEYLYNLEEALERVRKDAGVDVEVDNHVKDIARRARLQEETLGS